MTEYVHRDFSLVDVTVADGHERTRAGLAR